MEDLKHAEVIAIRRRADRNAHGHIAQALRLKLMDDIATFIVTIGAASILAGSCILIGAPDPWRPLEIVIAMVGGLITMVGVWQAVWQPGQRARLHKQWSTEFTKIEDESRLVQCGESDQSPAELMAKLRDASAAADLVAERQWRRTRKSS